MLARAGARVGFVASRRVARRLAAGAVAAAARTDPAAGVGHAAPCVTQVVALEGHRLRLLFDDGVEGIYDASGLVFTAVFEPLRDPAYFASARVDPELGTVVWPNGADLDPLVLYAAITGREPLAAGARRETG